MLLAGKTLQAPRMHSVVPQWKDGDIFTAKDDPDRMAEEWQAPRFLSEKDPRTQRERTHVTELQLPGSASSQPPTSSRPSFARVVENVLEPHECAQLLDCINAKGFTPALLNMGGGMQKLASEVRDGHRVVVDSPELTQYLLEVLRPHLPEQLPRGNEDENHTLRELNERCRFLCYTPGQVFEAHCDGCYTRPQSHPHHGDSSRVTVQFYLHDVPADHGGGTTFLPWRGGWFNNERLVCQPKGGSVLLFTQDLYHEGSRVIKGIKYTLRTEAMYGPHTQTHT